jgi:hypothetical protein
MSHPFPASGGVIFRPSTPRFDQLATWNLRFGPFSFNFHTVSVKYSQRRGLKMTPAKPGGK